MSKAENILTVSRYDWRNLPVAVVIDSAVTVFKESHRLPDEWTFLIEEDGLFDPKRNGYVHDIVKQFPHPNPYLRKVEDQIIEAMDIWAVSNNGNSLVWISPIFIGEYPCNKIEVLQKWPDSKGTNNVTLQFDCDADTCLRLVKIIFPELEKIKDPEELRKSVIVNDNLDINKVLEIVGPYIPKPKNIKEIPKEHFDYIANLAHKGADQRFIAYEMERLGMIGEQSFSCPGRGLNGILSESSLNINGAEDKYGSLQFTCPHCGAINTRPFGQLLSHCQHCGGDVKC